MRNVLEVEIKNLAVKVISKAKGEYSYAEGASSIDYPLYIRKEHPSYNLFFKPLPFNKIKFAEQKEAHTHPSPSTADKYDIKHKNVFINPYVFRRR